MPVGNQVVISGSGSGIGAATAKPKLIDTNRAGVTLPMTPICRSIAPAAAAAITGQELRICGGSFL